MSKEIKEQIDKLNEQIEAIVNPGTFALNPKVAALMREITILQKQCKHHFINGVCEFCCLEEE